METPENHKPLPAAAFDYNSNAAQLILLVEDSPDDAFIFLSLIGKSRIANPVRAVRDGREAVSYLNRDGRFGDSKAYPPPSAVFVDLKMPHMGGLELLQWMNARPYLNGVLRIVLTHSGELEAMQRAYELGAHSFLIKPLTHVELDNLVRHFQVHFCVSGAESSPSPSPVIPPSL